MPETDAEDRLLSRELTDFLHDFRHICRVTGTIREEHAVGVQCKHLFRTGLCGHNGNFCPNSIDVVQNTALHTEIHCHNMRCIWHLRLKRINLGRRDNLHDVARKFLLLQRCDLALPQICGNDHALHRTRRADMTSNSSCIYIIKAWDIIFCQKVRQALFGLPVVRCIAELTDHKSTHEGLA